MTQSSTTRLSCSPCAMTLLALMLIGFNTEGLAVDAGRFFVIVGDVRVVDANGRPRPAVRGSTLSAGDTVITGDNALAQLRMIDDGRISLRENTEFKLDDYNFKQDEPSVGRMFVNLLRGSFRSLTGLIGKRNRAGYRIRTPHATLGVRGTDHETTVLLAPRDGFAPGTFDVVFEGRTVMHTQRGQIEISPQQAGYTGSTSLVPQLIKVPTFLEAKQRARATTPPARAGRDKNLTKRGGASGTDKKAPLLNPLTIPRSKALTPDSGKVLTSPSLDTSGTLKTPILIAPTLSPTTTITSPTLSPTTTIKTPTLSPTTTIRSPTLSPTTTIKTPTLSPTTTIKSPTLTAPTTTLKNPPTIPKLPTTIK